MQSPSQDSRFHRIYEEHRSAVMAYCNSVTFSQRFLPSNGGCVGSSGPREASIALDGRGRRTGQL